MKRIVLIIFAVCIISVIALSAITSRQIVRKPAVPTSLPTPTPVTPPNSAITSIIRLVSIDPKDGQQNVSLSPTIQATFSQNIPNATFNIYPDVPFSPTTKGAQMTIVFSDSLKTNTVYLYSFLDGDGDVMFSGKFTTGNTADSVKPLSGEYDNLQTTADKAQREEYPDEFLATYTPYETDTFSVVSDFSDSEGGKFEFTVTQKGVSGKNDFLVWVKSLGMTDQEIQRLTITYQ